VSEGSPSNTYAVDHIAIAVDDVDKALPLWEKVLGVKGIILVREPTKEAVLRVGGVGVWLHSSNVQGSRFRRFVEERGEGLNHVALAVHSVDAALDLARSLNLRTHFRGDGGGNAPGQSFEGHVSFVDPKDANGVHLEFVERYTKYNHPSLGKGPAAR
jgi:methylmalonyl-CoA/ethylmalonyl-CoA epimerase